MLLNVFHDYNIKIDKDIYIYSVSTIDNPKDNTLLFCNKYNDEVINKIKRLNNCIILMNINCNKIELNNNVILFVKNPRKEYAQILKFILSNDKKKSKYTYTEDGYYVGENVSIGKNTIIEPFVLVDNHVVIKENCYIKSGVKIREYVTIGENCIIKENSVIGSSGFGIERDNDGTNEKIPHLGGVEIGNNVEVGALSCIVSGTIEPTIIEDYVKIDDCVFVAHNCKIGKGTFLIANCEVSGSVVIGEKSWIAPSACIINKVEIGRNVTIGIGSVVTKNISDNSIVAGNPSDSIENIKIFRNIQKRMIKEFNDK